MENEDRVWDALERSDANLGANIEAAQVHATQAVAYALLALGKLLEQGR